MGATRLAQKMLRFQEATMNDKIINDTKNLLNAAANGEVPAELRAVAEDNIKKTREAYDTMVNVAQAGTKAIEDIAKVTQAAAGAVGEKVVGNVLNNVEVAFDAAQKLARAKTVAEAANLQAVIAKDQLEAAGAQGKELLELTNKVAKETTEAITAIATKAADAAKKAA